MRLEFEKYSLVTTAEICVLDIAHLTLRFADGHECFPSPISFRLQSGELLSVVGDNGTGKTTLARLILGELSPTSGKITLCGNSPALLKGAQLPKTVGFVPQNPYRHFVAASVGDEVALQWKIVRRRSSLSDVVAVYEQTISSLGGSYDEKRNPMDLDFVDAWRTALALSLVASPRLLYIDEVPSVGDSKIRDILQLVAHRVASSGGATVITSHRRLPWLA